MYGLVNKALEDLICATYGSKAWLAVKEAAEVDVEVFVRMESYPDAITYRLVEAASRILGTPAEKLLEAFGEHWTIYTVREGHGELLSSAGDSLWSALHNLDSLHARIGLIYPKLIPPHFECTDATDHSLVLHYYSNRPGLVPMVIGMLKGMGRLFSTPISITQVLNRGAGDSHDAFLVQETDAPRDAHADPA